MLARPPLLPPTKLASLSSPINLHPLPKRGSNGRVPRVCIRHPHYEEPVDVLLEFVAVDPLSTANSSNGDEVGGPQEVDINGGVHHATVLTACAIITNNAFDKALLSRDRYGLDPVLPSISLDGILEPGDYWLQIAGPTIPSVPQDAQPQAATPQSMPPPPTPPTSTPSPPYPVVASFSDWRFPRHALPWEWMAPHRPPAHQLSSTASQGHAQESIADRVKQQQPALRPCCISGHRSARDSAHLVPKSMPEWFNSNMMATFSRNPTGTIQDEANRLPLRSDLHFLLDQQYIVLVPKPTRCVPPSNNTSTPSSTPPTIAGPVRADYTLAVHVINPEELEIVALYHNLSLQAYSNDPNIREYQDARPFLFARFAHSVFCLLQPFLRATDRLVLVSAKRDLNDPRHSDRSPPLEKRWMSPRDMEDRNRQQRTARSESGSRKRPASQMDDDGDILDESKYKRRQKRLSPFSEGSRSPVDRDGLMEAATSWYDENLAPSLSWVDEQPQDAATLWYDENLAPCYHTDRPVSEEDKEDTQRGRPRLRGAKLHSYPRRQARTFASNSCGQDSLTRSASRSRSRSRLCGSYRAERESDSDRDLGAESLPDLSASFSTDSSFAGPHHYSHVSHHHQQETKSSITTSVQGDNWTLPDPEGCSAKVPSSTDLGTQVSIEPSKSEDNNQ